jgi:hypothetical protein
VSFVCEIIQLLTVMFCAVELCINLTLGLLLTKHLTNGDQKDVRHALMETRAFDRICVFCQDRCCKC